jgi:ribosomal protein S18 acetylase RimI-like enzyme
MHLQAEVAIRQYQEGDRQEIIKIAGDTAFFGDPVEAFLDDRFLFADAFVRYYLDFESEYAWVADAAGCVVGYLTGCLDSRQQRSRYIWRTIFPVLGEFLRGKYRLGMKTWHHAFSMFSGLVHGEYPLVDLKQYPAHLHINVAKSYRSQGIGKKLIRVYLDQLRGLDTPGVHLETTSQNQAACQLYESLGFELIGCHLTRVWNTLIASPVENRVYGMKLIN